MCVGHGPVAFAPRPRLVVGTAGGRQIQLEWVLGKNCTEFENIVIEMAVEIAREDVPDAMVREAMAHAGTCARCARRLANEQVLSGVFAAAVAEDAAREAPPVVGKMLLTAFRDRREALRLRQRSWLMRAVTGAMAATLLVAAVVALRKPEGPRTAPVNAAPLPLAPKAVASVYRESRKPEIGTLRAAAQSDAESDEVMTDFIPVVYDPEPIERGRLVRIQLPRAALVAFGLPLNEDRTEDFVQAECLLDQDGLMRAVRFVE
jgi:hypothetical protein